MKNTKIIMTIPGSGRTTFITNNKDRFDIYNESGFLFTERKLTDEELENIKQGWEKTPHLLSAEGYLNNIKDKTIVIKNPEYPNNIIQYIRENNGKYDYIFLNESKEIRNALLENDIEYTIIFPEIGLKSEWFYRCYKHGYDKKHLKIMDEKWEKYISALELDAARYNIETYRLKSNEYIEDAIRNMERAAPTTLKRELLMAKIAMIKMIHQYMGVETLNGEKCYDHYHMSAGEAAYHALGIENYITDVQLTELEEKLQKELFELEFPGEQNFC